MPAGGRLSLSAKTADSIGRIAAFPVLFWFISFFFFFFSHTSHRSTRRKNPHTTTMQHHICYNAAMMTSNQRADTQVQSKFTTVGSCLGPTQSPSEPPRTRAFHSSLCTFIRVRPDCKRILPRSYETLWIWPVNSARLAVSHLDQGRCLRRLSSPA